MKRDSVTLKQLRAAKVGELENLSTTLSTENRGMKDDEKQQRSTLLQEIADLDEEIPLQERQEQILKDAATRKAQPGPAIIPSVNHEGEGGEMRSLMTGFSLKNMCRSLMKGGAGIEGMEAEVHQEAMNEARTYGVEGQGIGIPESFISHGSALRKEAEQRNYDATTNNHGKYTVATDVGPIIDALIPSAKIIQLGADVMPNLKGNVQFPRESVRPTIAPVAEAGAGSATPTDPFGVLELSPKRLTAYSDVTLQLLAQSNTVFDNWLSKRLGEETDLMIDLYSLTGDGSTAGHPDGLLNVSGVGEVFADGVDGTTGAVPSWSDYVSMETAVANANGLKGSLAYLTTPGLFGVGKTTSVDAGSGRFIIEGSMLNGYNVDRTTLMPSTLNLNSSNNQHGTVFGNWADWKIGFWGGIFITIDDVTQITSGTIRFVLNRFWDAGPGQPGSFCKMRDSLLS